MVYLPPGAYTVTGQIDLPASTILKGAGADKTWLTLAKQNMTDQVDQEVMLIPINSNTFTKSRRRPTRRTRPTRTNARNQTKVIQAL